MFRRAVAVVTCVSVTLMSIILPAGQTLADRRMLSEKSLESGKYTKDWDPKMTIGDYRITRADEAAVILDLKSSETTDTIIRFSGNSPIVWARYNGNDGKGRIDITRLERTSGDTVRLVIEKFTPDHGKRWSDFHMGDPNRPIYFHGINPFDNFRGPDDGLWHNINQGAFLAAVGMAQQNTRAHMSFTALADVRQDVRTQTSGGWFRKTTKTTVESHVKPSWILGLPIELGGPDRFTTAYCITGQAQCPEGYLVKAGVSFIPFNGGNMPIDEYLADVQERSQSGWTVLAFAVFIAFAAWAAAGALAGMGYIESGALASVGGAGGVGAIAGGAYAGVTLATQGGSPTTVQDGVFGATDDGVLQSRATGGFGDPTAAITNNFIRPENNDTQGGFLKLYRGNCPDTYSLQQCRDMGYVSDEHWGILQRPEFWRQYNSTYRMREGLKPQREVPVGAIDPYQLLQNGGAALQ